MKTAVLNSFLKFYVMGSPQVDLLDIVHVKVGFFAVLKMCIRGPLGKFVWSTLFEHCGCHYGYNLVFTPWLKLGNVGTQSFTNNWKNLELWYWQRQIDFSTKKSLHYYAVLKTTITGPYLPMISDILNGHASGGVRILLG